MGKGRIVLVPFPFTDLSGQKIRPALILYVSRGEDCIVAFISSVERKKSAFDVSIKATRANGLKVNSVIRTDKLATLQRKIVLGELGTLEKELLTAVDASLRKLFKL
ncbi:MAG TPA: type II toxin-antitoxin system PemK/MazF family toxin [Candidatus Paceibacterota bacterium]